MSIIMDCLKIEGAAIVIPAGSGKTTLCKKYKNIYDIDSFHSEEDILNLRNLYIEVATNNDWDRYNKYEISLIKDKINSLHCPFILLLHCKEKADLLGLTYLGACKINRYVMEQIAKSRGKTDKLRQKMTISNWESCNALELESYDQIDKFIVKICNRYKIKIN